VRLLGWILAAVVVLAGHDADAKGPRKRPPRMVKRPAREAPASAGVTTLRAPGPSAILLRSVTFTMGSTDGEVAHALSLCQRETGGEECREEIFSNELTAHEVLLSDIWFDRTEVTVARYRQCVAAGRCVEPPYASGAERFDRPDYPVVLVTWNDAASFCGWSGGRLPTEAEWERAARGAGGRRYPWGNVHNPSLANHGHALLVFGMPGKPELSHDPWDLEASDGHLELAPVGSYPDGRTPDGIDDMAGNVEEWVSDFYAPEYAPASHINPRGPDAGDERVVRGGSYLHARPWLRGAARDRDHPHARRAWRGFRCVRETVGPAPKPPVEVPWP
jgi:sulfatase modifying factor 1